jgi:hypothetical protein
MTQLATMLPTKKSIKIMLLNPIESTYQCTTCNYIGQSLCLANRDEPSRCISVELSGSNNNTGVTNLRDVTRSTNTSERDTDTENKAASKKHSSVDSWCLDACADNHYDSSGEHANAASKIVVDRTTEKDCRNRSNVISEMKMLVTRNT